MIRCAAATTIPDCHASLPARSVLPKRFGDGCLGHRRARGSSWRTSPAGRAACCGTNALAMKVIGKITMNDALLTTSGVGTSSPTGAMIHEIA